MPSATTPARIPAWQRLGLKLKSAQTPEQHSEPPVVIEPLKRQISDTVDQSPSKKAKKSSKNAVLSTSNKDSSTPTLARKKSVTFTPETKVEDGDSIKQLFSAWVAEHKSQDPSFQPKSNQVFDTPKPSQVEENIDTTLSEKERRVKRVKKSKDNTEHSESTTKQKKSNTSTDSNVTETKAATRPFLAYLRQYHESRDTWKFNKNHQNHLLKQVFNVKVIPSDHAHLIYAYVRGLQGGVRTRLRDAALAIKVKDQEDGAAGFPDTMAERDKRQREYDLEIKEYVATMTAANASKKMGYEEGVLLGLSDYAMADRVAKRLRAEQILADLGTEREGKEEEPAVGGPKLTYDEADISEGLRKNDGSSQKLARKRKQRTMAEDEDTSSSDDSSDSDSTSDDDSAVPPGCQEGDDSSSSSSSSSSGEEEEEDDDGSEEDTEEDSEESDSE